MTIRITLPTNMGLRDWADQIALDLDPYGSFGRLNNVDDWQNWAVQFLNNAALNENIPVPYSFTDWREWAQRFCQVVE